MAEDVNPKDWEVRNYWIIHIDIRTDGSVLKIKVWGQGSLTEAFEKQSRISCEKERICKLWEPAEVKKKENAHLQYEIEVKHKGLGRRWNQEP